MSTTTPLTPPNIPSLLLAIPRQHLLSSLALLLVAYIIRLTLSTRGTRSKKVENSPILGQPGDASFMGALAEGYKQVRCMKCVGWWKGQSQGRGGSGCRGES